MAHLFLGNFLSNLPELYSSTSQALNVLLYGISPLSFTQVKSPIGKKSVVKYLLGS